MPAIYLQFIHGHLIQEDQRLLFRPLKYQSRLQEMAHTGAIAKIPEGLEELSANSTVMIQVIGLGFQGKGGEIPP